MTTQTIKDQLEVRKEQAVSGIILQYVQENSHLTLQQLSDAMGDDTVATELLANTPLCELVNVEVIIPGPRAKNGHAAKRKGKKAPKNAPKKTAKKNGAKGPTLTLKKFLVGKKAKDSFKTKEYGEAASISSQTALTHLTESKSVKKTGQKRGTLWVVQ